MVVAGVVEKALTQADDDEAVDVQRSQPLAAVGQDDELVLRL